MKRMGWALTVVVVVLLMANILMGGDARAMVAAGRARCVAEGLPDEELLVGSSDCKGGAFGFGGHGVVEFGVRDAEPPRVFRVELQRWVNLLGWQPVAFTELPRDEQDPSCPIGAGD